MIEIVTGATLLPSENGHVAQDNSKLALAAPAGLARSMNRTGLLLAECALKLNSETQKLIREHSARTGIYCAAEPSTLAHPEIQKFITQPDAANYARHISPKWGLQCSIGLAASSAAILLGIEGGVHTFNHPLWGSDHAFQQAMIDLHLSVVDYALVCAVASFEDPLMIERWRVDYPQMQYAEAAGILLLKKGDTPSPNLKPRKPEGLFYGCADPLIHFLRESKYV